MVKEFEDIGIGPQGLDSRVETSGLHLRPRSLGIKCFSAATAFNMSSIQGLGA